MKRLEECWNEIRSAGMINDAGVILFEADIPLTVYAIVEGSSEGIAVVIKPRIPTRIEQFQSY